MKTCTTCKQTLKLERFYARKGGEQGVHAVCKECMKEKNRIYRENNDVTVAIKDVVYRQSIKTRGPRNDFQAYAKLQVKKLGMALVLLAAEKGFILVPKVCDCCEKEAKLMPRIKDYSNPTDAFWFCEECTSKCRSDI